MEKEKVFAMPFSKVYPMLIQKAVRKGRTPEEVYEVTSWLTGYPKEELPAIVDSEVTYGAFFRNAPALNPERIKITGSICGVRLDSIEDPTMREIRYLDKLVDELAKGRPMDKILRKQKKTRIRR